MNDLEVTSATIHQPSSCQQGYGAVMVRTMLLVILLLATGLRFHKLGVQSFWNDEGNSARLSERSLALIVEGTASDVHPPLYYLALRGWRELLGDSEFGLRTFSAFAGFLTVAATIPLTRLLFRSGRCRHGCWRVVITAAFLVAINPALVYYSQETRMYALLGLLALLTTVVLMRWLQAQRRWSWAIAYIALSTAGLYTHYFYPVLFLFQGLIVLLWVSRHLFTLAFFPQQLRARATPWRTLLRWLLMVIGSFVLYSPWLPIFARQTGGRASDQSALHTFLWDSFRWMLFGETAAKSELTGITVIALFLLILALFSIGRRALIPVLGVSIPLLAMFAAGATNPAFLKFLVMAVPFLLLLFAGAMSPAGPRDTILDSTQKYAVPLLLVSIIVGMVLSLDNLYNDPNFARDDYRLMAARVAEASELNAGVILNAPNQWEVFTYYHRQGAPVYPLPKGQPDPAILEPQLRQITASHQRLYVLFWGDDQQDPDHVVENWLNEHTFKASETWVGDVRFAVYAAGDETDTTVPQQMPDARFGDAIRLQGYSLANGSARPGDVVQVTLMWSTEEPLDVRYKVFLHLVNGDGELLAQQDAEPAGGLLPTTTWPTGEIVKDNIGILLPATLPPGEYRLLLGMYPVGDPEDRVQIEKNQTASDVLELARIAVE